MINLQFDTSNVQTTLVRMQMQISLVGSKVIPYELEAWQTEDMKRQYPNTETPNAVSAETYIWPRSRTYERTHKKREARELLFKRRTPLGAMPRLKGTPGGKRPILRQELLERLMDRVRSLSQDNLTWVTSSNELAPQVTEAWTRANEERKGK